MKFTLVTIARLKELCQNLLLKGGADAEGCCHASRPPLPLTLGVDKTTYISAPFLRPLRQFLVLNPIFTLAAISFE